MRKQSQEIRDGKKNRNRSRGRLGRRHRVHPCRAIPQDNFAGRCADVHAGRCRRGLHSHGWVAGWIASLIYTIVIGGIFGWLVSAEAPNEPRLMVWGGLYGLAWWVVSGLFVVPALLAKVPLSSEALDTMKPVALASADRARVVRRDSRIRLRAAHDVRRPASCDPCRPPCRLIPDRNPGLVDRSWRQRSPCVTRPQGHGRPGSGSRFGALGGPPSARARPAQVQPLRPSGRAGGRPGGAARRLPLRS